MKLVKKISWISIIYSVLEIALGICLIAMPNSTLKTIWYLIAGLIILAGMTRIANYVVYGFEPFGFVGGASEIVLGIAFVFLANVFADPRVFAVIVGIVMMISSVFKFETAIDAHRVMAKNWWLYVVYAIVLFALSMVLFCNPNFGSDLVLIITGVLLLVDAVFDIVTTIVVNTKIGRIKKEFKKLVGGDDGQKVEIQPEDVEIKEPKDKE